MNDKPDNAVHPETSPAVSWTLIEIVLLVLLFFAYAGDPAPMVNEAHYLVKAKNFWQPEWCSGDVFAASGKAHLTFYVLFGWTTKFFSLESSALIGRLVGWIMLAAGLRQLCQSLLLRRFGSLAVAALWIAGIEHGNLAGEWVVGGIEAKVPAYALVLFGMADLVQRRWDRVWLWFGAAAAFHVLTGGWSVFAAIIAWTMTELWRQDRRPLLSWSFVLGSAIAMLGLVPAAALSIGAGEEGSRAASIYVYERIPHHLLPANFAWNWYLRHSVLLVGLIGISWNTWRSSKQQDRLLAFTLGAVSIATIGMAIGMLPAVMPELAAKLLRFYWFRISDAIVPLTFAVLVVRHASDQASLRKGVLVALIAIAAGLVSYSAFKRSTLGVPPSASNTLLGWDAEAVPEVQRKVFRDWLAVCRWAESSTPQEELFLTPRHQQTFKWYADRAEVVNWKDVPQDANSLIQWQRRFDDVFPDRLGKVRVTIGYQKLREYRKHYGVRFMIVDRRVVGDNLPLIRVYPRLTENDTYAVYELPNP